MHIHTTFLIVGAGIAGLTTAIGLQTRNLPFIIIDKMPQIKGIGAGLGITSNAIAAFEQIGIANDIIQIANPLTSLNIADHRGHLIGKGNPNAIHGYNLTNYALHRADLHDALSAKVQINNIYNNTEVIDIMPQAASYIVRCSNDLTVHCKYIIGADGIHSYVRQFIFPSATIRYAGYTCWRATVSWTGTSLPTSVETWGSKGRFGITPLTHNRVYWYACVITSKAMDETYAAYSIKDLQKNFEDYHDDVRKALALTRDEDLLLHDISDLKPINTYHQDGILLIGDAAHATTPNLGQGACMGIEDAAVLLQEIDRQTSIMKAFEHFSRRRVPRCKALVNTAWRLGKIAQLSNPLSIKIRNQFVRMTPMSFQVRQLKKILDVSNVLY